MKTNTVDRFRLSRNAFLQWFVLYISCKVIEDFVPIKVSKVMLCILGFIVKRDIWQSSSVCR